MSKTPKEFVKDKLNEKTGQGITLYEHYLAHDTTISIGTAVSWIEEYTTQSRSVKIDELISKLEDALQLSKECINLFIDRETKGINPKIVKINKLKSEISELKEQIKKEGLIDDTLDLQQYITNMLYFAYSFNTPVKVTPEFDKWVELQINGIDEYFKSQLKPAEKEENDQQYIRMSKVFYFVVMHKTDCYRAFKLSIKHEGYKSPEGKKLIAFARQEIGYSDKTWSGDIYSSLYNTYKSIVVDGVNEPEQIKNKELWTNDKVIDLVNWYLRLCKIITDSDCRFELENQSVIDSFLNGDDYKLWWNAVNPEQTPDLDCGIYEEKQSGMREFVISEIQKGIIHPNPLTPSEMRVLNLCCKYLESL